MLMPAPENLRSLEAWLRDRLRAPLPVTDAHLRFAPSPRRDGWRPDDLPSEARRAAALILLYPTADGIALPLTIRHSALPHHAGQVSLPGGRIDLDEAAEHAALRETEEEIGVDRRAVRVLGPLSTLWVAVSNHVVQPFVGVTDARPAFRLAAREVERLIEAPLSHVFSRDTIGSEQHVRDGAPVNVPFFDLGGRHVWGATAMILGEFVALFEE